MKRPTKLTVIEVHTDTEAESAIKLIKQALQDAVCRDATSICAKNRARQAAWAIRKYRRMGKRPMTEIQEQAEKNALEAKRLFKQLGKSWKAVGERLGITSKAASQRWHSWKRKKRLPTYQTSDTRKIKR